MEKLSEKNLEVISEHLRMAESALQGLAALFRSDGFTQENETDGISEIIRLIRIEVLKVKQVIDNPNAFMAQLKGVSFEIGFVEILKPEKKEKTKKKKRKRKKK